jgi:magnesium chelatase family protein
VPWRALADDRRGEPSRAVAERVWEARQRQAARLAASGLRCNADMGPDAIRQWARPDDDGRRLLEQASRALGLSARAWHRILRVARTIADLADAEAIAAAHVAEAIAYRSLDREAGGVRGG